MTDLDAEDNKLLVLAKGAGYEMRATLGIAVFSGMIGVTIFGILLTPVFYYVIRRLTAKRKTPPGHDGHADLPAPIAERISNPVATVS